MADAATRFTDLTQRKIERRIREIYRKAQLEIVKKLDEHNKAMIAMDAIKRAQVEAGTITERQYKLWLSHEMFKQKQWQDKLDSVATTLMTANVQANNIVEGQKRAVFGENATYQAFRMEKDAGLDLDFNVYDSATVTRLIKEQPNLLPKKVVDTAKDKAWNHKKITNAITQGIIQGESIPQIAERIAKETSQANNKAMVRYARTAMTSAQNAGRIEAMHDAIKMGIKVKKRWDATLDNRTRDAHADLDGQVADVDEPFHSILGPIMYPGDPSADPANVYNCRCGMKYVYEEYPEENAQRRDNISGELIEYMTYKKWKALKSR